MSYFIPFQGIRRSRKLDPGLPQHWQCREPVFVRLLVMLPFLSHIFGMPFMPLSLCAVLTIFFVNMWNLGAKLQKKYQFTCNRRCRQEYCVPLPASDYKLDLVQHHHIEVAHERKHGDDDNDDDESTLLNMCWTVLTERSACVRAQFKLEITDAGARTAAKLLLQV